jgi:hypothetical protein
MSPYLQTLLVPIGGGLVLLLLLFEFLVGKRIIHFKGKLHQQVHRATAWTLVILAPLHGLFALHIFFGWPF